MIRWCAWCQRFQGETAPYDELAVTHGLCEACAEGEGDVAENLREVKHFYDAVFAAGLEGDPAAADALVVRGRDLGLRPVDVLVAVVQPALYEIGARWARCDVSVADQARFSTFADHVADRVAAGLPLDAGSTPRVLFVETPHNTHRLGPRVAALWLRARGVSALTVEASDAEAAADLVAATAPAFVGVSAALAPHLQVARDVAATLARRRLDARVLVGGVAVRLVEPPPGPWTACRTLEDLDTLVG